MAQLDNATDSDSGEWGFKSLRADQKQKIPSILIGGIFYILILLKSVGAGATVVPIEYFSGVVVKAIAHISVTIGPCTIDGEYSSFTSE